MRNLKWVALALAVASASCGGDDASMCGDGGCVTGDAGPMQWGLSSGTNQYKVTAVNVMTDGCAIDPAMVMGTTIPLTYQGGTISLGDMKGSPAMPSLGSGPASGNTATLTRENDAGDATCTYHQKDVSMFELFDHDKFTLKVTETETMFSTGCGTAIPTGGMCTSNWTWTFAKQ
jgi:hypothetical protein